MFTVSLKGVFLLLMIGVLVAVSPLVAEAANEPGLAQIIVNLPGRTLELYNGDVLIKEFPIAIGKPSTPTPTGEYSILEKEVNPCWYPPGKGYVVPSGPANPLGYRWMGVAPLYGIHGTNAPWSIGGAVSNGCMRMQEEDVEALFELVSCDTPVKIEYERIKVRVNAKGQASIGVYPDVYGRQRVTLADAKQALTKAGLDGLADDVFLQSIILAVPDRQVFFAQLHKLKVNGTLRSEYVLAIEGKKYVPINAIAGSGVVQMSWDDKKKIVRRGQVAVPGLKRGNTIYVESHDLSALVGGREKWNQEENCLEVTLPIAKLDGQVISADIHKIGDDLVVPAMVIAKMLGERVKWQDNTNELFVQGRAVPVVLMENQPFISASDASFVFNLRTAWDDSTQTLEFTYPLHPIDYSMFLDPGEEFFE